MLFLLLWLKIDKKKHGVFPTQQYVLCIYTYSFNTCKTRDKQWNYRTTCDNYGLM